jgi:hypothetical protein
MSRKAFLSTRPLTNTSINLRVYDINGNVEFTSKEAKYQGHYEIVLQAVLLGPPISYMPDGCNNIFAEPIEVRLVVPHGLKEKEYK